jgi:peroxin-1
MTQRVLEDVVAEAVNHAPSSIILDDLDGLIPCGLEGPKPATTVVALAEFFGDLIDLYQV